MILPWAESVLNLKFLTQYHNGYLSIMEKPAGKKRQSIRWQLLLAFAAVSVMAISSGLLAWFSMEQSRSRIRLVTEQTLPIVDSADNLSREVALFSVAAAELPRIGDELQRRQLLENLQDRMVAINSQLEILHSTGFEPKTIKILQQDVRLLISNLVAQARLAGDFLLLHNQLLAAVSGLLESQQKFARVAQPRISEEHHLFQLRGRQISGDIRELLRHDNGGTEPNKNDQLDQKIRVGFETLISTVLGEMRSNLELMSLTHRVAGMLHEAADVHDRGRIAQLKEQFLAIMPDLDRIKLILGQALPENRQLLIAAMPVIRYGLGDGSIFALRDRELQLRAKAAEYTVNTLKLSDSLSQTTDSLGKSGRALATRATGSLDRDLRRGLTLQVGVVLFVIMLSFGIGYRYVGRRIIHRIQKLQVAMEDQAAGKDVPIPVEGDDEIGRMARALQSFVEQRGQVEEELREVVASLNEAKRIAKLGNFVHHVTSGRWSWSDVFHEIIGREVGEHETDEEGFWELIHQDDRNRLGWFFEKASEFPNETFDITIRLKRDDGKLLTVQLFVQDNGLEGTEDHIQIGTLQDITERARMEEELLQARKMESLGTLAGGIGHDFNNIMTGILGNVSLAKRLLEPGDKLEELLDNAEVATRRARELTARLLSFTETATPVCAASHLPDLLQEAAEFVLSGTAVNCEMDVEEGLLPVAMDPGQMTRVIHILVENSVQALKGTGVVTISCRNMMVGENNLQGLSGGSYVRIQVIDQGSGITPENLNRVFDPYFTTIQRDSRKGRGLGLAICRSVIVRHGGAISVESEPGRRTVFTVWLPTLHKQIRPEDELKRGRQSVTQKILLMDDEPMVRDIAKAMLTHLGYSVTTARDGREAIDLYEKGLAEDPPFSLLIFDLTVPGGMGGKEAAEYMKKHHPEAVLVVSSGYSNDPVVENYQAYGFIDTISKPYDMAELQSALRRLEKRLVAENTT